VPDAFDRVSQRFRQLAGTIPVTLKQVESDALRGFLSDARHATQAIDQADKQG
jgi:hypothetical protein